MTPTKLTHPSPQITAGCIENTAENHREFDFEITDDHYVIYLSQRQTRLAVTSNGKTIHDGLVFPGMMRMASRGEKVHIHLYERCKSAKLTGRHDPGKGLDFSHIDSRYQYIFFISQMETERVLRE